MSPQSRIGAANGARGLNQNGAKAPAKKKEAAQDTKKKDPVKENEEQQPPAKDEKPEAETADQNGQENKETAPQNENNDQETNNEETQVTESESQEGAAENSEEKTDTADVSNSSENAAGPSVDGSDKDESEFLVKATAPVPCPKNFRYDCAALLPEDDDWGDLLRGAEAIADAAGVNRKTVVKYWREEGLPMVKKGNEWQSYTKLIENWRMF